MLRQTSIFLDNLCVFTDDLHLEEEKWAFYYYFTMRYFKEILNLAAWKNQNPYLKNAFFGMLILSESITMPKQTSWLSGFSNVAMLRIFANAEGITAMKKLQSYF